MTALAANALTSVASVEQVLGDIDDDLCRALINRASDIIEHYCSRTFASTVYTNEEYDGDGSNKLTLNQYPVITFTKLEERTTDLNENSWQTVNSVSYFVDLNSGVITYVGGVDIFRDAPRVYRATYTAGYATTPDDLEDACIELVVFLYNHRRGYAQSESIGDYSISYGSIRTIKDLGLDLLLDQYKKPVL